MRALVHLIPLPAVLLVPVTVGAQEQTVPEAVPATASPPPLVAEATPAPGSAPSPTAPSAPPVSFSWEALADMYYMANFTGDPSTQGPVGRAFDTTANNFALNYAKLGVGVDTASVAFRLDLGAGHTAAIVNSAIKGGSAAQSPGTTSPEGSSEPASALLGLSSSDFLIQQAFGTWKITPDIALDAGRFVTTAGAEVIEASKNWLYSRSFLFNGIPFLHTGLRLNAAITPALKLQLSLVNGWNNDVDNNVGKTGGVSVAFTPPNSDNTTVVVTSYFGKENPHAGGDTKILVDGVFTRDIGKGSVGLNIDYLKTGDAWWWGGAIMGRYFLTESFNLAMRAEFITSKKGAIGVGDDLALYEGTLMGGYVVAQHFELRA